MPVRYEQPAPLDAALLEGLARSRGGGGGDDGRLAVAQAQAQNDFFRAAVGAAAQRADAADTQFGADFARDNLRERQRQFDAGEANQFGLIDRRAAAQAWLSQQDMSYAEQLRLQKMESEVGAIEADDTLARFEKDELILSKRSGIDLGRRRLEQTRARQEEMQTQEYQKQLQREAEADGFLAKNGVLAAKNFVTDLGDGRKLVIKGFDARSRPTFDVLEPQKEVEPRDGLGRTPKDWYKAMADTVKEIDAWVASKAKKPANAGDDWQPPEVSREVYRQAISEAMERRGFAPSVEQHFGGQAPGGPPRPPAAGGGGGQPPPEQQQQVRQSRVKVVEALNDAAAGLPEDDRARAHALLARARSLVEAGAPGGKEEADAAVEEVGRILQQAGRRKAGESAGRQHVLTDGSGEVLPGGRERVRRLGE